MQTIEVSDAVYSDIMSRRIGREAISTTLRRELRPLPGCKALQDIERVKKGKYYSLDDAEKKFGI